MSYTTRELVSKARALRLSILDLIYGAQAGHIGGALSSTDILTCLYYGVLNLGTSPTDAVRDRFILSKGHACEGLYCILNDLGYIDDAELASFMKYGGLSGHPHNKTPGVEHPTGSLGHGLSVCVGMALAVPEGSKVFCLLGDGELAEGSVWEAAMAASHHRLDNLICIIDRNRLQIAGRTDDVLSSHPLSEKWQAFGWKVHVVDGHNMEALKASLTSTPWDPGKPNALIAETVKGKGCSFMEDALTWHHKVPTTDEYARAKAELEAAIEAS